MTILPGQQRAERRSRGKPANRPLGAPAERRVGAPLPAATAGERLRRPPARAAGHRNRRTWRRPERSCDIPGIPFAAPAEHLVVREERWAVPAAFRNARRLARSRGSRFRSSRTGYSAQFLRSSVRQAYRCSGIPRLDIADFQPHRMGIAAKLFGRMFRPRASRW